MKIIQSYFRVMPTQNNIEHFTPFFGSLQHFGYIKVAVSYNYLVKCENFSTKGRLGNKVNSSI